MRKFFQTAWWLIKWGVIALICLEILSFVIVTASIYLLYGQIREGEGVDYDPYAIYINHQSNRRTLYNPNPPDKSRHKIIWMFGGSTTRGATDHDERTIPSYLSHYLNRVEPYLPAVVINFGVDGFNSLLETKYLQKELIENPVPPDVIIFYDAANDAAYFCQHRTPYGHHGYRRLRALIESYHRSLWGLLKPLNAAVMASFTKELYDKFRHGMVTIDSKSPLLKKFAELNTRRYDYVNKVAKAWGARFYLVFQPVWYVETCEIPPSLREKEKKVLLLEKFSALRLNHEVTIQALTDRLRGKPYFVDFQNVLCGRQEMVYQSDGIHLQDAGRQMVARKLAGLLKKDFLPQRQLSLQPQ